MLPKLRRELASGDRVGPFRVLARLGEGGMAELFAAEDTRTGRKVALKRTLLSPDTVKLRIDMFRREARIACALKHPNIVETHGLIEDDGDLVLVMELLEGATAKTLGPQLRKVDGALPLTVGIIMQVASALDHLHEQLDPQAKTTAGLVHRDVAPDNLFICSNGRVKLIDFGLAKDLDDGRLTRAGILKGKAAYMSPEQASGAPLDRRTDQYSLGVTFYWLAVGVAPFERDNVPNTLNAIMEEEHKPLWQHDRRIPVTLDPVMARVFAKDPAQRYPSCSAFAAALTAVLPASASPAAHASLSALARSAAEERLPTLISTYEPVRASSDDYASDELEGTVTTTPTLPPPRGMVSRGVVPLEQEKTIIDQVRPSHSTSPEGRAAADSAPSDPPRRPYQLSAKARQPERHDPTNIVRRGSGTELASDASRPSDRPFVSGEVFRMPSNDALVREPPTQRSPLPLIAAVVTPLFVVAAIVTIWGNAGDSSADGGPVAVADANAALGDGGSVAAADGGADDAAPMPQGDSDGGAASVAVDAGPAAPRKIAFKAPASVTWRVGERDVGSGNTTLEFVPGVESVLAFDTEYEVETVVPLPTEIGRVVDYARLPRTEVQILVRPWAEVSIGKKKLGVTPLKPLWLVAGRYTVVLEHNEARREEVIDVGGRQRMELRYRF